MHKKISIKGARVHNLKNVNVDIPRKKLVVITGPSGSGNHRLLLTQYTRKDKEGIWKIFPTIQSNF